jgi:hypothetical protein
MAISISIAIADNFVIILLLLNIFSNSIKLPRFADVMDSHVLLVQGLVLKNIKFLLTINKYVDDFLQCPFYDQLLMNLLQCIYFIHI